MCFLILQDRSGRMNKHQRITNHYEYTNELNLRTTTCELRINTNLRIKKPANYK